MTCIAAIADRKQKKVHMMGDRQGTNTGGISYFNRQGKLWTAEYSGRSWIFGESGTIALLQACRYGVPAGAFPEKTEDAYQFLVLHYLPALRATLREQGLLKVNDGLEFMEGDLLIGADGQLFNIDSKFGIFDFDEGYAAIGSGREFALGSLGTTEDLSMEPEARLRRALGMAKKFCISVGGKEDFLAI